MSGAWEPLEKLTRQTLYSHLNTYLKYLFRNLAKEPVMTGAERREQITAEIMERTGITEAMIERLVHGFYAKVRADAELAPVFEPRIAEWEPHLQRMCAFWSSVALM